MLVNTVLVLDAETVECVESGGSDEILGDGPPVGTETVVEASYWCTVVRWRVWMRLGLVFGVKTY